MSDIIEFNRRSCDCWMNNDSCFCEPTKEENNEEDPINSSDPAAHR